MQNTRALQCKTVTGAKDTVVGTGDEIRQHGSRAGDFNVQRAVMALGENAADSKTGTLATPCTRGSKLCDLWRSRTTSKSK